MARIHFWLAGAEGGSIYRGVMPGMSLQWLGHQVTWGQKLPPDAPVLDVLVGCRVAQAGPSQLLRELKDFGVRIVIDLDDDYFHLDPTNPAGVEWIGARQRQLADNLRLADVVTCCSEVQARVLREYADNVRVVPNGLPAQMLGEVREYAPETLTVGWAGTTSTMADLPMAARALNRIVDYRGGVQVRLVGVDGAQALRAGVRAHERTKVSGWIADFNVYLQHVKRFDVWVAPYRDTAFNVAKFATKWLESSVAGIPLIASAIEPYKAVIRHGENGFLVPVGQEHLFGRYLKELIDDPGLRKRIGMAARAQASGSILQAVNSQWQAAICPPAKAVAA